MTTIPNRTFGQVPWSRKDILQDLEQFLDLYERRPLKDNAGGMRLAHMFATWFMMRKLSPHHVIESGVWKGQGTWLLEQACPQARLICLDLNLSKRVYISSRADYHEMDFSEMDWSNVNRKKTVVFFDDHQNAYRRMQESKWFGFRHLIFEDNWPSDQADFYTLRAIMEETGFGGVSLSTPSQDYTRFTARLKRKLLALARKSGKKQGLVIPQYARDLVAPNRQDGYFTRQNLDTYYEFPPLLEPEREKKGTPDPLITREEAEKRGIGITEARPYNWIAYARFTQ